MLREAVMAGVVVVFAAPADAGLCNQPYAPDISLNAKSSKQDLSQMHDDVQSFIEASDVFQQCVIDAAKHDSGMRSKMSDLLSASQQDKERVGNAFNAAVRMFAGTQSAPVKMSDSRN